MLRFFRLTLFGALLHTHCSRASSADWQGELQPLAAAKKENGDLKPVVVTLQGVEEVQLRGDKVPQYWVRTRAAWYALVTPLPRYTDFWKVQDRNLKASMCARHHTNADMVARQLVAAMERELASKNPRSFEQLVSRISRDVPSLKNDANDFVARVGDFVLAHFAARVDASPLLAELKTRVEARREAGASGSQVRQHCCGR